MPNDKRTRTQLIQDLTTLLSAYRDLDERLSRWIHRHLDGLKERAVDDEPANEYDRAIADLVGEVIDILTENDRMYEARQNGND